MLDLALVVLALLCLVVALQPVLFAGMNLPLLRTPVPDAGAGGLVSILIPARNEAANIARTVRAALASTGVPVEVLVGDDHSTDATPEIVRGIADPRLRLVPVPALPEGWTGKNHACAHLAEQARGAHLLFNDADVHLEPVAAAALAAQARTSGA
ncbi:glycosyltransferase family 2 protein, partial [Methylobacterium trifolii]